MLSGYNPSQQQMKSLQSFTPNSIDSDLQANIQKYDRQLLSWLQAFYNAITREKVNMEEVTQLLDMVQQIKKEQVNNYLVDLLFPESAENSKIPNDFPMPTSSFQLHNQLAITTNASGNFSFMFNPFFLESGAAPTNSTFFLNTNVSLTGIASSNFYTSTDAGLTLPLSIYQKYRVVSAAIQVRYIYRLDAASGIFGGAVNFETVAPAAISAISAGLARYGNFNLIDDAYFTTRSNSLEGIRLLYVPYDPSVSQFTDLGTSKASSNFIVYGQGLPPSVQCVRVDYFINIEALCDPVFQNYVPTNTGPRQSKDEVQQSIDVVTKSKNIATSLTSYDQTAKAEKQQLETGGSWTSTLSKMASDYLLPAVKQWGSTVIAGAFGF